MGRKNFGLTLIELLIVLATLAILITLSFFTFKTQMAKGRDGRRKADLNKLQKALEDYMNDHGCYPNPEEITTNNIICGGSFSPYLTQLPCDPINNSYYNFFYSYDQREDCKTWYKIYAKFEYDKDLIIEKVGCKNGCGPVKNYNYWVSSPNMTEVNQIAEAEDWWPKEIAVKNTLVTPSSSISPSLTPSFTATPTLFSTPSLILTPPLICDSGYYSYCQNGDCIYYGTMPPFTVIFIIAV